MVGTITLDAVAPVHADKPLIDGTENQFLLCSANNVDRRADSVRAPPEIPGFQRSHDIVSNVAGVESGECVERLRENRAFVQRAMNGRLFSRPSS